MNKFRRLTITVFIAELLLIVLFNMICYADRRNVGDRQYRVDIKRIENALRNGETVDAENYTSIVSVVPYDEKYKTDYDYAVVSVNGALYSIEYENTEKSNAVLFMNLSFAILLVITAVLFLYFGNKILKPFNRLSDYSVELAKGNLSRPVKEDKNKFFGKFLWGMDMLRENLESNKKKELELQKDKKTLILSISHDIKTPLSAIRLYTRALKEDIYNTEEKRQEAFQGIEKNVNEIEGYVSDIVLASKEEFLNLSVSMGEFYLSAIMARLEAIYKEKLAAMHTRFEVSRYDECLLQCDADKLEEVLQNMLENAIKYGDGQYVRICVEEEEDCKLISVINSGCTLKEEELPHLFNSFYRGGNSEKVEGSGLGLYIAKTLMHMMDGEVYAQIRGDEFMAVAVVRMV